MINQYIRILLLVITGLITSSIAAHAQTTPGLYQTPTQQRQLTPGEIARQQQQADAAGQAGCAVCGLALTVGAFIFFVLNIALLIWVARDAKARGMDSAIYLFSRPQGELIQCPYCKGKRLAASAICPHCHHT